MTDLRTSLQEVLRRTTDYRGRHFVPAASIAKLITPETVREALKSSGRKFSPEMDRVIASSWPRLFAILAFIGKGHHISSVLARGFGDDRIPLKEEIIPDFKSETDKQLFTQVQPCFPPVFEKDIHIELNEDTVLPFLERNEMDYGSFGAVYKVRIADGHLRGFDQSLVAIKKVQLQSEDIWDTIMREVETLRKREHPNIVPLIASFTLCGIESGYESKSLNMIFPIAEMNMDTWMNLDHVPQHLDPRSREDLRRYLYNCMYELVSALSFLHRELDGMVTAHHDLKPKNILLLEGQLKICDLGRSHLVPLAQGSETDGPLGTFTYHPPEYWTDDGLRADRRHGRAFDMWSMGCILVEIATLVVYGWEKRQVQEFRQRRRTSSPQRQFKGQVHRNLDDDSFHNHTGEVRRWVRQLRGADGSRVLDQCLDLAEGMLAPNPGDRLYSWEAELDLFELLNPDNSRVVRLEKGALRVQRPKANIPLGVQTPLHRAILQQKKERETQLLKAGWSISPQERGKLMQGHQQKGLEVAVGGEDSRRVTSSKELADFAGAIQRGSGAEAESIFLQSESIPALLEERDPNGFTVLHFVARFGSSNTLQHIIAHVNSGDALDTTDIFGKTPMHHACEKAPEDVLNILFPFYLKQSLEDWTRVPDSNGKTPLHWAAQGGNLGAVRMLLSRDQDAQGLVSTEDDAGHTALHLAISHGHSAIADVLRAHGGV